MTHYIISYDLKKAKNYQTVWALLERWGAVRLLESFWVVTLNNTVGDVRQSLQDAVDGDDAVAVVELKTGSDWATLNANKAGTDWLTSNIRRY